MKTEKSIAPAGYGLMFTCLMNGMKLFQGCAMAYGFCASNNLDAVLMKLEQVTKNEMVPKSSGFLGLMKVS